MSTSSRSPPPFHVTAIAGAVAGSLQAVVGNPLDLIKTRLQMGKPALPRTLTVASLFRGLSAPLFSASILNLVLFSTTSAMRDLVRQSPHHLSLKEVIMAAWLTAPIYVAFVTPVEFVKVNLMASAKANKRISPLAMVWKSKGLLWKGFVPTLLMRLWGLPFYFGANHFTLQYSQSRHPQTPLSPAELMLGGCSAGFFFWFSCLPLDTVKTLVQSSDMSPSAATQKIWKDAGVRGFYRGLIPCLLRSLPANAVVFFTVDYVTNLLHKQ